MGCMGSTCKMVSGLLVAVAGLMLLLYGLGSMTDAMLVFKVAGACILLNGLAIVVHKMGLCPMCASKDGKCC